MSQARRWCFTLNNPENGIDGWNNHPDCTYAIYQLEQGESGTPHLQGYVEFKVPKRLAWLKRHVSPLAHFAVSRGSPEQNRAYCSKEEGRLAGPREHGAISKGAGHRSDLDAAAALVEEGGASCVAEQMPAVFVKYSKGLRDLEYHLRGTKRKREGFLKPSIKVYWGPSGAGKTRRCYEEHPDLYRCVSHTGGTLWMDGYDGEDVVLFDDFQGGIQFRLLLQILDGYPLHLQIKGGHVQFLARVILFTSNLPPSQWYAAAKEGGLDASPLDRRLEEFGSVDYCDKEPVVVASRFAEDTQARRLAASSST